ncbi:MAG: nucleotidyltransferase family protein [Butyrivibrio sp.]|nr:nucleotidyltransferase family protein [Butyrivibrio sp.]
MQQAKMQTGADFVVLIMSGDYTQRGVPAIVDKNVRTYMALQAGADLVLELPTYYSLGSAEYFSRGAISILSRLGVIDTLAFGSECGDLPLMQQIADLLAQEPPEFVRILNDGMRKGLSFPAARQNAILHCLEGSAMTETDRVNVQLLPESSPDADLAVNRRKELISPNNILGIEYLCALKETGDSIRPFTLKRLGAGYHDNLDSASDANTPAGSDFPTASASGIRRLLLEDDIKCRCNVSCNMSFAGDANGIRTCKDTLYQVMPHSAADLLLQWPDEAPSGFMHTDLYSQLLQYQLIRERETGFTKYADLHADLSDKICNHLPQFTSFDQFTMLLKSKDLTYTRIQRTLMHIVLDITSAHLQEYTDNNISDMAGYARILGFRKDAAPLLHTMKKNSTLPLISKLADAARFLQPLDLRLLQEDIRASEIYDIISGRHNLSEYQKSPIIL